VRKKKKKQGRPYRLDVFWNGHTNRFRGGRQRVPGPFKIQKLLLKGSIAFPGTLKHITPIGRRSKERTKEDRGSRGIGGGGKKIKKETKRVRRSHDRSLGSIKAGPPFQDEKTKMGG